MAGKNLFEKNTIIDHNGQELLVGDLISEGLTGQVYKGQLKLESGEEIQVAIKVMKALEFADSEKNFLNEGVTLQQLMYLEVNQQDGFAENLKIAPIYYGMNEYVSDDGKKRVLYFVMEFIGGRKIPDILERGEIFSELDALLVASHLYRTLDILHTQLSKPKTFIDLKFENLWWLPPRDENSLGQLKMTDFGTLEDKNEDGVRRDILLGGVYFLAILTGHTLIYSSGELKEPAETVIRQHQDNISWGTRRLLQRLLHRNADFHFSSISVSGESNKSLFDELMILISFWQREDEVIAKMADSQLCSASEEFKRNNSLSDKGVERAMRALAALDILRVRDSVYYKESSFNDAVNLIDSSSFLTRGKRLLRGGGATVMAQELFEQGVKWEDDPIILRHWFYVAQIAKDTGDTIFQANYAEIEDILKHLHDPFPNAHRWDIAIENLISLKEARGGAPTITSSGLDALITECQFYKFYEEAKTAYADERFSEAAERYKAAEDALAALPETVAVMRASIEEGLERQLSFERRIAQAEKSYGDALKNYDRATEALSEMKYQNAVVFAKNAYDSYHAVRNAPFHDKRLSDLSLAALKKIERAPEAVHELIETAFSLAAVGLYNYAKDQSRDSVLDAAFSLKQADKALERADFFEAKPYLQEVLRLLREKELHGEEILLTLGKDYANKFANSKSGGLLEDLAHLFINLFPSEELPQAWLEQAGLFLQDSLKEKHAAVDRWLLKANWLIAPLSLDTDPAELLSHTRAMRQAATSTDAEAYSSYMMRLNDALALSKKIKSALGDADLYKKDEIDFLTKKITELKHKNESELENFRKEKQAFLQSLSTEATELKARFERLSESDDADESDEYQVLREEITDFLYRTYLYENAQDEQLVARVDALGQGEKFGFHDLRAWAARTLNGLGGQAWADLRAFAEEKHQRFADEFSAAKQAFKTGDIIRLRAELERLQALRQKTSDEYYALSPEWRELDNHARNIESWYAISKEREEVLRLADYDEMLLDSLSTFPDFNLPNIYWEGPAQAYVNDLKGDLESSLTTNGFKGSEAHKNALRLVKVLQTAQAPLPSTEKQIWEKNQSQRKIFYAVKNQQWDSLEKHVAETEIPKNLSEYFLYNDWEKLEREVEDAQRKQEEAAARKKRRKIIIAISGAVLLCILIISFVALLFNAPQAQLDPVSPVIYLRLHGTATPTATATSTMTPTPTFTPTATVTPTFTPTAVPPSNYRLLEPIMVYPRQPLSGEAYWLLNDSHNTTLRAHSDPAVENYPWQEETFTAPEANGETYLYTETGETSITWQMDMPFEAPGMYAVYIVDTAKHSQGAQQFTIALDGMPVMPYRGGSDVIFLDEKARPEKTGWLPLGVYLAEAGQTMSIHVDLPPLTAETPFAADRILIVRLNEPEREMLDALPGGRPLVSLLDDSNAVIYQVNGSGAVSHTYKEEQIAVFDDVFSWAGSMSSVALPNDYGYPGQTTLVDWESPELYLPGEYEVLVWIPANHHATVPAEYKLLVNGEVLERINPAEIAQEDHLGEWVSLGRWKLEEEASLGLRMIVAPEAVGELGVDAVAILSTFH